MLMSNNPAIKIINGLEVNCFNTSKAHAHHEMKLFYLHRVVVYAAM